MERLNWAVLGLIGIVTALGLGTSSGAGKTKTELAEIERNFQKATEITTVTVSSGHPKHVAEADGAKHVATSSAPACSACQSHASSTQVVTVSPNSTTDQPCPGNCQATGVCCDKSLPKTETAVATAKTEMHVCEGECCLSKKATATAGVTVSTDCPLTKAADAIASLTKNYVCEGGECLTKPGLVELAIGAADPNVIELTAKPEGLSNLTAAADVVQAAEAVKPDEPQQTITIRTLPDGKLDARMDTVNVKSGEGLKADELRLITALDSNVAAGMKIEIKPVEKNSAVDNSRAAARAAKLAKIEQKLEAPWNWEFERVTIEEIVEIVQTNIDVPVIIDRKSLEEAAFDMATPFKVTKQSEIEAGDYLRGLLEDQGLTWIIPASNDRVLITTRTAEQNTLINRVYDVSEVANSLTDPETLVERIQSLIEPTTWRASGGMGDLGLVQNGDKVRLIALNGYWVQRQVAEMLANLRLGNDNAVAPRGGEKETSAVMRRHQLPGVGLTDDLETKRKLLVSQKRLLINLLKQTEGFDSTVFEIVDYNNEPVLMTKQLPAVHRQIAETIHSLQPKGTISGFGTSCDYGDFDPGQASTGKLPGSH